jgi:hypothetical protein
MQPSHNVVGWFEIPVLDMRRAITFYEGVFGFRLQHQQLGQLEMAWFPAVTSGLGAAGSLVFAPDHYTPSRDGTLIYFTAFSGDVAAELSRVEPAGGTVLRQKTLISDDVGYMGLFLDSEGNRIAVHSRT